MLIKNENPNIFGRIPKRPRAGLWLCLYSWPAWGLSTQTAAVTVYKTIHLYSTAVQNQKAVSAYFTSEQILHFRFADQSIYQGLFTAHGKWVPRGLLMLCIGVCVGGVVIETTVQDLQASAAGEEPAMARQCPWLNCPDKGNVIETTVILDR